MCVYVCVCVFICVCVFSLNGFFFAHLFFQLFNSHAVLLLFLGRGVGGVMLLGVYVFKILHDFQHTKKKRKDKVELFPSD